VPTHLPTVNVAEPARKYFYLSKIIYKQELHLIEACPAIFISFTLRSPIGADCMQIADKAKPNAFLLMGARKDIQPVKPP